MFVIVFAAVGALVGSIVGPPLLGGSVGLLVGGSLGLARRPTGDGDVFRVLGICAAVFGATTAAVLDRVSHLHVCLQPWRAVVFDWLAFNNTTHRCLTWWSRDTSFLILLDSVAMAALLLVQGVRAREDARTSTW